MVETTAGSRKVTGATLKTLINNAANAVGDDVDALQSVIAPEFDSTLNYSAGDYVYSEGKLYRFTADHANGALDGTDTVEVTVTSDMVNDVTVNGTSVVNNGIAQIPLATNSNIGVVRGGTQYGIKVRESDRQLIIDYASEGAIKSGASYYYPVVPKYQHNAAFYGLAKAAGDSTQSSSANAVGTYTNEAKAAIKSMLGIADGIEVVRLV